MRDSIMRSVHPRWLAAAAIVVAGHVVLMARVDVKVEYDKKFDFKPI
jgi:hypothetical protein